MKITVDKNTHKPALGDVLERQGTYYLISNYGGTEVLLVPLNDTSSVPKVVSFSALVAQVESETYKLYSLDHFNINLSIKHK